MGLLPLQLTVFILTILQPFWMQIISQCGQDITVHSRLLRHLGVMASTRASLMFYNTEEEIVKFTESLKEIRRKMGYAE